MTDRHDQPLEVQRAVLLWYLTPLWRPLKRRRLRREAWELMRRIEREEQDRQAGDRYTAASPDELSGEGTL